MVPNINFPHQGSAGRLFKLRSHIHSFLMVPLLSSWATTPVQHHLVLKSWKASHIPVTRKHKKAVVNLQRNKQPMQWQDSSNTRSRLQKKCNDCNVLFSFLPAPVHEIPLVFKLFLPMWVGTPRVPPGWSRKDIPAPDRCTVPFACS